MAELFFFFELKKLGELASLSADGEEGGVAPREWAGLLPLLLDIILLSRRARSALSSLRKTGLGRAGTKPMSFMLVAAAEAAAEGGCLLRDCEDTILATF